MSAKARELIAEAIDALKQADKALLVLGKQRGSGKAGGQARAAALSPERRSEIARDAARKRWAK